MTGCGRSETPTVRIRATAARRAASAREGLVWIAQPPFTAVYRAAVADRRKGAGDDRHNGASFGGVKRTSRRG